MKQRKLLQFLLTFLHFAWAYSSFLDLDEINLIQYDVQIGNQPIVLSAEDEKPPQVSEEELIFPMTNKFGQKYHCLVPKAIKDEDKNEAENVENAEKEEETMSSLKKAKMLLEPMRKQPCLLRTKDWWTYEFCFGKQIRQYHMEDNRPSGDILILGLYDHDQEHEDDETLMKRHHSQIYTNGTQCDLTGNSRTAEVRFECEPSLVHDVVTQVDEPQSCEYIITIKTSKICDIPQFRPPPVRKPLKMECQPILTPEEFDKYEKFLERQKELEAKKVEEAHVRERKKLLKVLEGVEDAEKIDIETAEGLAKAETMVGEKLAERLIEELGLALNGKGENIEEIQLESGEMQSRPKRFENVIQNLPKRNLNPRSDASDESEMVEELVDSVKQMSKEELEALKQVKKIFKKQLQNSVDDIIEETEQEMNMKMDGVQKSQTIQELLTSVDNLMSKIEKAEEKITKANEAIDHLQDTIESKEDIIEDLKDDEEIEEQKEQKVNVKVANFGSTTALKDSPSEKRVIKHLERAIKDKLAKSNLDTGGRQIEVKFITTSIPAEISGDEEFGSTEEARQFQGMIYNLLVGNEEAFQEIDNQRKLEKGYHFTLEEEENLEEDEKVD